MSSKVCFKCGETKPLTDFYAHSQMADGHLNKCKECTKKDATGAREARVEYYREYDRARASLPHRREQAIQVGARWRERHPNRKKAHTALRWAVKSGKIDVLPCLICGEKAEAHHADYDNPLGVTWLCAAHHKQTHAMARRLANEQRT